MELEQISQSKYCPYPRMWTHIETTRLGLEHQIDLKRAWGLLIPVLVGALVFWGVQLQLLSANRAYRWTEMRVFISLIPLCSGILLTMMIAHKLLSGTHPRIWLLRLVTGALLGFVVMELNIILNVGTMVIVRYNQFIGFLNYPTFIELFLIEFEVFWVWQPTNILVLYFPPLCVYLLYNLIVC